MNIMINLKILLSLLLIINTSLITNTNAEVIELDEDNWSRMLEDEWMIEFFAPWCPACKSLTPIWSSFAETVKNEKIKIAKIDVTKSPSLSGRFFVTALPTIYHVTKGEFRQYRGSRDVESFASFVENELWTKVEPLSAWKRPNSVHMSVLSYFFKLSHYLKNINTLLHDEYGLPAWGAYAVFAIGTIFFGAILGLILVCIVDFLYPPKKSQRQSFSETKQLNKSDVEDIEDLEDEDVNTEDNTPEASDKKKRNENEDDVDDDVDEDIEDVDDDDTSEGEKVSNEEESGDDVPESEKKSTATGDDVENSSPKPEIRKRKQRKAD